VAQSALLWDFVADIHFQGPAALTLDSKGRLAIPARHREVLDKASVKELTITRHPDGALMIFPRPAWEGFRQKIEALPVTAAAWRRIFLGNALDVEIDGSSRVLIAPELRAAAGLDREVMLLGMGSHLELWDRQRHAEHEAKTLAQPMHEALNFSY
jgi:MraZ protein